MNWTSSGRRGLLPFIPKMLVLLALFLSCTAANADEPYARSKNYDLQHSKVVLRFDLDHKKVMGDVTHTVNILQPGTEAVSFDSVGLQIQSVKVNKTNAKFERRMQS